MPDLQSDFSSAPRLFRIAWRDGGGPELAVEAWWGCEALSGGFEYAIDLLSTDAGLPLKGFLGRALTLFTALSDGRDFPRSGYVREARSLGSDGGFSRYRLKLVPWIWMLSRSRHNRVFQERTVIDIVETVFADYADIAAWHWHDDIAEFLADARSRSYCVQYDESDYAFVSRLLAEEGIGWCVDEHDAAPGGHRLRFFADSRRFPEDVLSASAHGGAGIRYHRADSQEDQDSLVAFRWRTRSHIAVGVHLAYDYKRKRTVTVQVPTTLPLRPHDPRLESYDVTGPYAWASIAEAERYGRLAMEAIEVRVTPWHGRGTVRSLRPGTYIDIAGLPVNPRAASTSSSSSSSTSSPSSTAPEPRRHLPTGVLHIGINNLMASPMAEVAARLVRACRDDAEAGWEGTGRGGSDAWGKGWSDPWNGNGSTAWGVAGDLVGGLGGGVSSAPGDDAAWAARPWTASRTANGAGPTTGKPRPTDTSPV